MAGPGIICWNDSLKVGIGEMVSLPNQMMVIIIVVGRIFSSIIQKKEAAGSSFLDLLSWIFRLKYQYLNHSFTFLWTPQVTHIDLRMVYL